MNEWSRRLKNNLRQNFMNDDYQVSTRLRPNSPGPLMDDWKVTDDSSVNFMTSFSSFSAKIQQKMKKKTCHEIYG